MVTWRDSFLLSCEDLGLLLYFLIADWLVVSFLMSQIRGKKNSLKDLLAKVESIFSSLQGNTFFFLTNATWVQMLDWL